MHAGQMMSANALGAIFAAKTKAVPCRAVIGHYPRTRGLGMDTRPFTHAPANRQHPLRLFSLRKYQDDRWHAIIGDAKHVMKPDVIEEL